MRKYGVLVIGHGSRDADWVRLVDEAVAEMRLPAQVPVYASFLEIVEGRLIPDGIRQLEEQGVSDLIVLPLFVSSGSTHIDEIRYALGVTASPQLPTDLGPFRVQAAVHWCEPLDDDPEVADIIVEKLRGLAATPERATVLLVGHGSDETGFRERWMAGLTRLASMVKERGGFAETDTALLLPDQLAEKVRGWTERRPECDVIVAPVFLSEGYFTRKVIPARLEGLRYGYNGRALLPNPLISRWMEKRVKVFLE